MKSGERGDTRRGVEGNDTSYFIENMRKIIKLGTETRSAVGRKDHKKEEANYYGVYRAIIIRLKNFSA